jgi:hypothetical protein
VVPTRGVVPVHDDEDRLAQRLQHRLARRAGPELRHEGLGPGGRRRDDRLLLAREVVEEGAQGDVGLGRDLLDREALDPEQLADHQRRQRQRVGGDEVGLETRGPHRLDVLDGDLGDPLLEPLHPAHGEQSGQESPDARVLRGGMKMNMPSWRASIGAGHSGSPRSAAAARSATSSALAAPALQARSGVEGALAARSSQRCTSCKIALPVTRWPGYFPYPGHRADHGTRASNIGSTS